MCSGSEAGSYLRLIDFMYHSPLGLKVMNTRKRSQFLRATIPQEVSGLTRSTIGPLDLPRTSFGSNLITSLLEGYSELLAQFSHVLAAKVDDAKK